MPCPAPLDHLLIDPVAAKVRVREIVVGGLRGNEIEVYDGLAPGERVVSAGVTFVRDGMDAQVWQPQQESLQ